MSSSGPSGRETYAAEDATQACEAFQKACSHVNCLPMYGTNDPRWNQVHFADSDVELGPELHVSETYGSIHQKVYAVDLGKPKQQAAAAPAEEEDEDELKALYAPATAFGAKRIMARCPIPILTHLHADTIRTKSVEFTPLLSETSTLSEIAQYAEDSYTRQRVLLKGHEEKAMSGIPLVRDGHKLAGRVTEAVFANPNAAPVFLDADKTPSREECDALPCFLHIPLLVACTQSTNFSPADLSLRFFVPDTENLGLFTPLSQDHTPTFPCNQKTDERQTAVLYEANSVFQNPEAMRWAFFNAKALCDGPDNLKLASEYTYKHYSKTMCVAIPLTTHPQDMLQLLAVSYSHALCATAAMEKMRFPTVDVMNGQLVVEVPVKVIIAVMQHYTRVYSLRHFATNTTDMRVYATPSTLLRFMDDRARIAAHAPSIRATLAITYLPFPSSDCLSNDDDGEDHEHVHEDADEEHASVVLHDGKQERAHKKQDDPLKEDCRWGAVSCVAYPVIKHKFHTQMREELQQLAHTQTSIDRARWAQMKSYATATPLPVPIVQPLRVTTKLEMDKIRFNPHTMDAMPEAGSGRFYQTHLPSDRSTHPEQVHTHDRSRSKKDSSFQMPASSSYASTIGTNNAASAGPRSSARSSSQTAHAAGKRYPSSNSCM